MSHSLLKKLLLVSVFAGLATAPRTADAEISSVTVDRSRPFEHADYTYAEITMRGTVARADGSVGNYAVPIVLIYPTKPAANGVGVVDWVNSAFYHFFEFPAFEFGTFQFAHLISEDYLFDQGYTYASVQWNKAVTDIFGPQQPDDGQPHNHLAYGSIEQGPDAWEILRDAAKLLKNPSGDVANISASHTVVAQGYSQTAALQMEFLAEGHDPARVYDGHLVSMIGLVCWKRDNEAPHYGFIGACNSVPSGNHGPVIVVVSESDMSAFAGFHSRNASNPNWRQYELAGVSHLPQTLVNVAPEQNPADPRPVFRAAFRNLKSWILEGTAPPPAQYLDGTVDSAGNFVPVTDADGNWTGGLRLPHLESALADGQIGGAPLGVHAGLNAAGLDPFHIFIWLGGTFERFDDAELAARYPSRANYVKRVSRAANALHDARYILNDDRKAYSAAAEAEPLPFGDAFSASAEFDEPVAGGCSTSRSGSAVLVLFALGFMFARRRRG